MSTKERADLVRLIASRSFFEGARWSFVRSHGTLGLEDMESRLHEKAEEFAEIVQRPFAEEGE